MRNSYALIALLLLTAVTSLAQVRLYDARRDAAAQDAKTAVEKVQNGAIFRKQSASVQALIDKDVATTVADARVETLAMINGLRQWSDVEELSARIKSIGPQSPADVSERRRQMLTTSMATIKNQILGLTLSAAPEADELKPLVEAIGDIDSVFTFANDNLGTDGPASITATTILDKLQSLYKTYQGQFDALNKIDAQLRGLRVNVKKALLARLKVEQDYLVSQTGLYVRYEREFRGVEHWKRECSVPPGIRSDEYIDETFDRLAHDRTGLELAVRAVFACGSLAAEGMLPGRLLTLRLAQLDHLLSIQLSAENARIYEAVLGGGVERLALFYQGGLKPEALAQLLQSLSTVGVFGKLLSQ